MINGLSTETDKNLKKRTVWGQIRVKYSMKGLMVEAFTLLSVGAEVWLQLLNLLQKYFTGATHV